MNGRQLVMRYAGPERRALTLLLLLTLLGVALNALSPWPLKLIVDHVLVGDPLPQALVPWISMLPGSAEAGALLTWLAVATVALFAATQASSLIMSYVRTGVAERMHFALACDVFDHLQRLSVRYHARSRSGDAVYRVSRDSQCVGELVTGALLPAVTAGASLAVLFVIMWGLDPLLAVLAVLATAPFGAVVRWIVPRMTQRTYDQRVVEGEVMSLAEQTLSAIPIVQAFGREPLEHRRFVALAGRTIHANLRTLATQLQYQVGVGVTTAVGTMLIMGIGGLQVLHGELSVGGLLVFLAYLAILHASFETVAHLGTGYASAAAGARRVLEVLTRDTEVSDSPAARTLPAGRTRGSCPLRFDRVSFAYEPGRPVLEDVSFTIECGETVALVGPSGAGKSTLVSLVLRFFDPGRGAITFDGFDLRSLTLASLRRQIAIVLQEPYLLPLTVAENIAYGRPDATRREVVAAAQAADADGFIRRLPAGYDTTLGERGQTLSGGEQQRLAIARAFLKDAPLLILDEPTAALDAATESSLLEALRRLASGRTTMIIAHRFTTVRDADRILVLDAGRVVESGTHPDLMAKRGVYFRFHRVQASANAKAGVRAGDAK